MMMTLNPPLPAVPTDNALTYAMTLLAVAADPAGTKARMDELVGQITAIHAAVAEHDAAAKTAQDAAAALAELQERERFLIERQQAVSSAQTALDVASSANAARAKALDDREAELAKREQEHAAKVKANEDRIAQVRASLA